MQDISNFDTDCFNPGILGTPVCDNSDSIVSAACFSCLISQPTDATWGPIIEYNGAYQLNLGGCYSLKGASAACAQGTQLQSQCEATACDVACKNASQTSLNNCVKSADTGECASYVTSATCASNSIVTACQGGSATSATFDTAFMAMAAIFCGP